MERALNSIPKGIKRPKQGDIRLLSTPVEWMRWCPACEAPAFFHRRPGTGFWFSGGVSRLWRGVLDALHAGSFGGGLVGLYNFQKRFVAKILSGEKQHTIRAVRLRVEKPGNILHLYTGLRHKGATLLMRAPCVKVEEIFIDVCEMVIDGVELGESDRDALAVRDGFADFAEMLEFWAGRLPFKGHIIHWKFEQRGKRAA